MFKITNLKRLLIITIMMVIGMGTTVLATNITPIVNTSTPTNATTSITPLTSSGGTINVAPTTSTTGTISTAPTTSTITATTPTPTPKPSAVSSYNSNLPKTGIDYSIVFVMLASVICALFAYKKIREYNIKY